MVISPDHIFEVFTTFPAIAQSSRWTAILNRAPIAPVDLIRRAGQLHTLRSLSHNPPSPFLVIKGPALAELAYPSPLQRHSLDLDILVEFEHIDEWLEHLNRAGFEGEGEDLRPHAVNQIALKSPLGIVELHWALALPPIPTPTFSELLQNAQTVMIGDLKILTLGPLDGAVHLCLHFHQHLGDPSILMDLALWLVALDLRSEDVLATSDRWKLGHITTIALYILGRLECASSVKVPPAIASLGELLLEEYQSGRTLEGDEINHFMFQLLSMTLLPNPGRAVLKRLFLGPHQLGNMLGKWTSFSLKQQ